MPNFCFFLLSLSHTHPSSFNFLKATAPQLDRTQEKMGQKAFMGGRGEVNPHGRWGTFNLTLNRRKRRGHSPSWDP